MLARVVKPFSYSDDGLKARDLSPGDVLEILDGLAEGLAEAGLIVAASKHAGKDPFREFVDYVTPEHEHVETKVGDGDLHVKHIGRGKYAVMRGSERLTHDPLDKDEAESALAEMVDATK